MFRPTSSRSASEHLFIYLQRRVAQTESEVSAACRNSAREVHVRLGSVLLEARHPPVVLPPSGGRVMRDVS